MTVYQYITKHFVDGKIFFEDYPEFPKKLKVYKLTLDQLATIADYFELTIHEVIDDLI
jgi:hypothetical protein